MIAIDVSKHSPIYVINIRRFDYFGNYTLKFYIHTISPLAVSSEDICDPTPGDRCLLIGNLGHHNSAPSKHLFLPSFFNQKRRFIRVRRIVDFMANLGMSFGLGP